MKAGIAAKGSIIDFLATGLIGEHYSCLGNFRDCPWRNSTRADTKRRQKADASVGRQMFRACLLLETAGSGRVSGHKIVLHWVSDK